MDQSLPPAPVDSATLILLREDAPGGMEVLLVERHAESRAFAGAHVFPGGCIDPGDCDPLSLQAYTRLIPQAAAARLGGDLPPPAALAFWIAAIRELFEETGILLASQGGRPLDLADPARRTRFQEHRAALLGAHLTFADLVSSERLRLATDEIEYFGRLITPVHAPRRYDTRFFVGRLPLGQEPVHDRRETIAALWSRPAEALEKARSGAILLAPPTLRMLEELRDLGSTANVLREARNRCAAPILPKLVEVAGRPVILYPGDADYARAVPGQPLPESMPGPRDRAVMDGTGWRSVRSRLD